MIVYERNKEGILVSHEEPQDCIVHVNGKDIHATRLGYKYLPTGFGYAITPILICKEEDAEDLREFMGC